MKNYMKKFKNAIADVVLIKHFYKTFLEIIGFESDNIFLDEVLKKVIKKTAKEKNQNLMLYEDIAAHIQSLAKNKQIKKINKNLLQETSKTYSNLLISNHKNNQKLQEIISKKTKLQQDYNDLVKKVQKTHHDKAELESESKLKTSSLDNSNKKNQDLEIKSSEISESILNLRSNLKKQKSNEHSLVLAEDKNKKQKLHNDFLTEKLVSTEKSFKDLEYKNQNLEFKIKALEVQREKNMKIITRENKKLEKNEENKNFCNKTENGVTFEPQKFINRIRSRSPRANFSTKPLGPINFPLSLSPRRPKFPVVTSRQGFVMNKKINFNNKPVACNNVYNQDQVVTSSWSLVLLLVLFIILLIIY
jgi:myosin heavy subunit